jgi:hypothetical protein
MFGEPLSIIFLNKKDSYGLPKTLFNTLLKNNQNNSNLIENNFSHITDKTNELMLIGKHCSNIKTRRI